MTTAPQDAPSSLMLSATRSAWSVSIAHGTELDRDPRMVAVREEVLKRDRYTCQHCGWKSERWQEVNHKDGNHRRFALDNLETVCPLCHQVFHLASAASTGGGSIIWLPEISQAVLHHICIAIFIALRDPNPKSKFLSAARGLWGALETRKAFVESNLASGASDPGVFAQVLLKMAPEDYARRHEFLAPLRLLPYASRFPAQIDYWASAQYGDAPVDVWDQYLPEDFPLTDLLQEIKNDRV